MRTGKHTNEAKRTERILFYMPCWSEVTETQNHSGEYVAASDDKQRARTPATERLWLLTCSERSSGLGSACFIEVGAFVGVVVGNLKFT